MTEDYKQRKILRSFRPLPPEPEDLTEGTDYQAPPDYAITEGPKLLFEASKQLTTLNAGSIVVIGTFLRDIFPTEQGTLAVGPFIKGLIAASFVCFGVSLILATFIMLYFSRIVNRIIRILMGHQSDSPEKELRWYEKELQWDPYDRVLRWVRHREPVEGSEPVEGKTIYLPPFLRKLFHSVKSVK